MKHEFEERFLQLLEYDRMGLFKIPRIKDSVTECYLLEVTPEVLWDYSRAEERGPYDQWLFEEHLFINLDTLISIGVISSYEMIGQDNIKEKIDKFEKGNELNFNDLCHGYCGEYYIYMDREKYNLFREIYGNTRNLKLNCSLLLIKEIIQTLKNQSSDIESLIDHLEIDDDKFIFYDMEILVYGLATYKKQYIAKILNYIINTSDKKDINSLLGKISLDKTYNFYTDELIQKSTNSEMQITQLDPYDIGNLNDYVIRDMLYGNIGFEENVFDEFGTNIRKSSVGTLNTSSVVQYNTKDSILEYNGGNPCNFSSSIPRAKFIEILYKNLNNWITNEEIGGNPGERLKEIRAQMKKIGYSIEDTKKLFQSFTIGKTKYFIMIG